MPEDENCNLIKNTFHNVIAGIRNKMRSEEEIAHQGVFILNPFQSWRDIRYETTTNEREKTSKHNFHTNRPDVNRKTVDVDTINFHRASKVHFTVQTFKITTEILDFSPKTLFKSLPFASNYDSFDSIVYVVKSVNSNNSLESISNRNFD